METWLREHLVDYIMPTPYLHAPLLQEWHKIGGDSIHICPDLMPRAQSAASYARLAKEYYSGLKALVPDVPIAHLLGDPAYFDHNPRWPKSSPRTR